MTESVLTNPIASSVTVETLPSLLSATYGSDTANAPAVLDSSGK